MFSRLFRKKQPIAESAPVAAAANPVSLRDAPPTAPREVWAAKLQACLDDEASLLALAREAPSVEIKLSAVAALSTEDALRLAEREFRTRNQGVHRLAKQRYLVLVAQRENREQARRLIDDAAALAKESMVPANRLVELDHAWQLLDASALTEELRAEYASLSAQLTAQLRERGEQQQVLSRWSAKTKEALRRLTTTCAAVESGTQAESDLAAAVEEVKVALSSKPPAAAPNAVKGDAGLADACLAAMQQAADLTTHLAAQLAAQNKAREAREEEARRQAKAAAAAAAAVKATSKPAADPAAQHELSGRVKAAENALAAGQLSEARKHLLAIDQSLDEGRGKLNVNAPLHARIEAIKTEYARLKGWQHWGGGRVREDLVDEAEALARAAAKLDEAAAAKLDVKVETKVIEQLRQRWKDLDRLGGAGGKALWARFDAALKAAYVPIAAQQDKHRAAREKNLEARLRLIEALDALRLVPTEDAVVIDWREIARALEHFQSEWRKLGPVDRAVPHKARDALLKRQAASLARIDSPLQEARRIAQSEREKLIVRARTLSGGGGRMRDAAAKVRELQAEWQQHAKSLPLARGVEAALWSEFKAATDDVFKQRDADVAARDAEFKDHKATREALIARLEALNPPASPAEIERAVAGIDREWRNAGDVAPSQARAIGERFRAAREAATQRITDARQRAWQTTCDTLLDKLALCEELEAADDASAAGHEDRWQAQPALPQAWEDAIGARFKAGLVRAAAPAVDRSAGERETDAVLLRLEVALDIPSPPEFQSARRDLRLLAMKIAMEGQQSADAKADDAAILLIDALGRRPNASQRNRLQTIIAALRERPTSGIGGAL